MVETLKTLLEKHPDWADMNIVIYCMDGHYDWVGGAGRVYKSNTCLDSESNGGECMEDCEKCTTGHKIDVLVFAPN